MASLPELQQQIDSLESTVHTMDEQLKVLFRDKFMQNDWLRRMEEQLTLAQAQLREQQESVEKLTRQLQQQRQQQEQQKEQKPISLKDDDYGWFN